MVASAGSATVVSAALLVTAMSVCTVCSCGIDTEKSTPDCVSVTLPATDLSAGIDSVDGPPNV